MNRRFLLTLVPLALAGAAAARADDLTGSDRLLCSAESIVVCYDDGTCETGDADALNVPKFIEVDLVAKRLSTTKASGLNRTSAIESLNVVLNGSADGQRLPVHRIRGDGENNEQK